MSSKEKETSKEYKEFDEMDLKMELLRGVYSYGFEIPSKIQQTVLFPMISSRNLIAQAQSGSGKTSAFIIPMLQNLDFNINSPQTIILVPTRELAKQIHHVVISLGEYLKVKAICCTGGTSVLNDTKLLKEGVQIVVGTPGRVFQMLKDKELKSQRLKMLIIDEADEMIESFRGIILNIISYFPGKTKRQICLFSTTFTKKSLETGLKLLPDPYQISLSNENIMLKDIKQFKIIYDEPKEKIGFLKKNLDVISFTQCMIFVNSSDSVDSLAKNLKENFVVSSIHNLMDSSTRDWTLLQFRTGKSRILICTDLLSRGIDIHGVSFVINFDLPITKECYIHRIGRSARYGRKGVALNFFTKEEEGILKEFERFYSTTIEDIPDEEKFKNLIE